MNHEDLKNDLLWVYQKYLENPNDRRMREKARNIHVTFVNEIQNMNGDLQRAVKLLLNIGYDLSGQPKPSRSEIIHMIKVLRMMN